MIRHKVKVLETEQTMDKAGKPFLRIKTQNLETGKPWTYTTHDPAIWNEFTDNRALDLGVEKRGDFWNIVEVEGLTGEAAQKAAEVLTQTVEVKHRSYALSYAKDLAVANIIPVEKVILFAELYRRYLDSELELPSDIEKVMAQYVDAIIRKEITTE